MREPQRLRSGAPKSATRERIRPEDAQISIPPSFGLLFALALAAIVLQSTLLHTLRLHGAQVSLVTVLVVWTGLRGGITSGGWLGLLTGVVEDALGGAGTNVIGSTLVGFVAGLLSVRFFSDSLPVFVSAVAAATWVRGLLAYAVLDFGLGERGSFQRITHELVWQTLLNCGVAIIVLLVLRVRSHMQPLRQG